MFPKTSLSKDKLFSDSSVTVSPCTDPSVSKIYIQDNPDNNVVNDDHSDNCADYDEEEEEYDNVDYEYEDMDDIDNNDYDYDEDKNVSMYKPISTQFYESVVEGQNHCNTTDSSHNTDNNDNNSIKGKRKLKEILEDDKEDYFPKGAFKPPRTDLSKKVKTETKKQDLTKETTPITDRDKKTTSSVSLPDITMKNESYEIQLESLSKKKILEQHENEMKTELKKDYDIHTLWVAYQGLKQLKKNQEKLKHFQTSFRNENIVDGQILLTETQNPEEKSTSDLEDKDSENLSDEMEIEDDLTINSSNSSNIITESNSEDKEDNNNPNETPSSSSEIPGAVFSSIFKQIPESTSTCCSCSSRNRSTGSTSSDSSNFFRYTSGTCSVGTKPWFKAFLSLLLAYLCILGFEFLYLFYLELRNVD